MDKFMYAGRAVQDVAGSLEPCAPGGGQISSEIWGSDLAFLTSRHRALSKTAGSKSFRYVDLFSGCGGMSLGVDEAAKAAGMRPKAVLAIDNNKAACEVYRTNFRPRISYTCGIEAIFAPLGSRISAKERRLQDECGRIDLIAGGPPCQGHSDLNNFSRRNDPKNALYQYMARAAQVLEPKFVVAENVPGLPHDRSGTLDRTVQALESLGYCVTQTLIDVLQIGVPQRRRRHILIASRVGAIDIDAAIATHAVPTRSVRWAIGDLVNVEASSILDHASRPSPDNERRINYLFEKQLYDLPNNKRPPCHRDKKQTYNSVYGRLNWDSPSQTVTSGFYSMCMGRYVHPALRRTLTAHEAARLQFLPDFFDLSAAKSRTAMAQMIANAVPPKLSYVVAGSLFKQARRQRK